MNIQEALRKLDEFCKKRGWNGRDLANGTNYRTAGQTIISTYSSGTDQPGTIEVAFEVSNIAKLSNKATSKVNEWIKKLQNSVGSYARPKTRYQYPRIAISNNEQVDSFINSASSFLNEAVMENTEDRQSHGNQTNLNSSIDEYILSSILTRRGQPKFRESLLAAYSGTCAISGCTAEAALEAAHITPHAQEQSYEVSNGVLLRADIHTLFDLFLISINPEGGTVVVSEECRPSYDEYHGVELSIPSNPSDFPNPSSLMAHYLRWKEKNGS